MSVNALKLIKYNKCKLQVSFFIIHRCVSNELCGSMFRTIEKEITFSHPIFIFVSKN